MRSEWRRCRLGDFIELHRGFDLPSHLRTEGSVPVVSSSGISGTHAEAKVSGPGVVTGRYGTIGEVFFVNRDFWPLNTTLFVSDFKGADPQFVAYFLRTLDYASISAKSAVPGINRNHLHEFPVVVPEPPEQQRIAGVLCALDHKIDSNQRLAATLERTAEELFRARFVDFVGVEAFDQSAIGPIPAGWDTAALGDHVCLVRGRSYKSSELQPSETALVTLKSVRRGGGYSDAGLKPYTGDSKPEQRIAPGEVIVACTDLTQAAEVLGKPALVAPSETYSCLVASLDLAILRPISDTCVGRSLLYFLLRTDRFQQRAYAHASGTTVLHLGKAAIPGFIFALPPADEAKAFDTFASPVLDHAMRLETEARRLTDIRETLLPKLISGDIRVPNTETPEDVIATVTGQLASTAP